jgi:acetyl-CoA carboxylase carboxyl transferase subunit beta
VRATSADGARRGRGWPLQAGDESAEQLRPAEDVLPKIRAVVTKKAVSGDLWKKCPSCEQMLLYRELEANLHVYRNCGDHLRISAEQRLKIMFGDGDFTRIELPKTILDPLKFRDRRRYADRLREGQAALGAGSDAVIVAHGQIDGFACVVAALEFQFIRPA